MEVSSREHLRWKALWRMALEPQSERAMCLQLASHHPWAGIPIAVFTVDLPGLIRGGAWIMAPDLPEWGRPWGNRLGVVGLPFPGMLWKSRAWRAAHCH